MLYDQYRFLTSRDISLKNKHFFLFSQVADYLEFLYFFITFEICVAAFRNHNAKYRQRIIRCRQQR